VQTANPGLALVGVERRLQIWFARYVIALVMLGTFLAGFLPEALLLIVISEFVFINLRRQPNFSASTYRPPAPEQWQTPIAALRWAGLLTNAWAIGTAAIGVSIVALVVLVILTILDWHNGLGVTNFAVLVLYAAWLSTRPLWIGPLRTALKVGATRQLSRYLATLNVATDGVEFDMRPAFIIRAPESYRFFVGFNELDEVRLMDGLTAQGYWGSMEQYDPTLLIRMEAELLHFAVDQRARPSILSLLGFGTHVLLRGPTVLYMLGNADPFGPPAVAAWQAWRARHPAPTPIT
jgi:hypothetical protein